MTQPDPLTRDTFEATRPDVHPHEHHVFVFDAEEDMVRPLGRFLDEGVRRKETSVFVHSFPEDETAWRFLERAYPQAAQARAGEIVVVSLYRTAFEGSSARIDYNHVNAVVSSLVQQAEASSRTGVRIFVDASRRYFESGRVREWFDFEKWLGRRLQANVGLVCAYQRRDLLREDIFPEVLDTHAYRFGA